MGRRERVPTTPAAYRGHGPARPMKTGVGAMMNAVRILPFALLLSVPWGPTFASGGALTRLPARSPATGAEGLVTPIPYVTGVATIPERPVAGRPTSLVVQGVSPYACVVAIRDTDLAGIILRPRIPCEEPDSTWRVELPLGLLAAGRYLVVVHLHVDPPAEFSGDFFGNFTFAVAESDTVAPPPGPLPYVNSLRITAANVRIPERPICASDSLLFLVQGTFPNPCWVFRRIDVVPILTFAAAPIEYRLVIVVDDMSCIIQLCPPQPTAWQAALVLPPVGEAGSFGIGV